MMWQAIAAGAFGGLPLDAAARASPQPLVSEISVRIAQRCGNFVKNCSSHWPTKRVRRPTRRRRCAGRRPEPPLLRVPLGRKSIATAPTRRRAVGQWRGGPQCLVECCEVGTRLRFSDEVRVELNASPAAALSGPLRPRVVYEDLSRAARRRLGRVNRLASLDVPWSRQHFPNRCPLRTPLRRLHCVAGHAVKIDEAIGGFD